MGITPAIPAIPLSFSVSAAVLLPLDSVSLVTYQAGYYKITDMFKPGHHLGGPGCHHRGRHVPYRKASRSDVALRPFTGESMPSAPESAILTATIPGINQMWAQLLFLAAKQEHARGTYRYLYDDPEHSFYFLEKGRVTILHGATNGRVQDMLYMQSGTLFNVSLALGSSLTHFLDAGCQFYCLTNVTVWKFPGSLLHDQDFIRSHPAFIENLMSSIGLKLLLMHNTLSNSGTAPPLSKLCRFYLNMSQASGNARELSSGISQTKLANLLGIHRVSLLRVIQKLKRDGALQELTRDRLVIKDPKWLRSLAMQ